jgi:hypothetical protein
MLKSVKLSRARTFTTHMLVQGRVTEAGSAGSMDYKIYCEAPVCSHTRPTTIQLHLPPFRPSFHPGDGTMAPTVYTIVPKSDAVIVLKVSTTRFAVWDTADETETTTENIESDAKGEESKTVGPNVSASSADHISRGYDEAALATVPNDTRVSVQEEASQVPTAGETTTEEMKCEESACDSNPTPNSSTPATECGDDPDAFRLVVFEEHSVELPHNAIHYQVSSEHMKVASPILAHMISVDNKVGGKGGLGGCYYIILEDCNEEALHILLNILHLKNREVPRKVNLDLLAKLAVLIDRYKCTEAVEVFLGMWTEAGLVIDPVPSEYCRELVLWLYVAWVAKMPRTFKDVTTTAIEFGVDCSLRTMGLPIPVSVSGK